MTSPRVDAGSFRDRLGRVFYHRDQVYRALSAEAYDAWKALEATRFFADAVEKGHLVATREVDLDGDDGLSREDLAALSSRWRAALVHERIPFVSYPYEWSFSMLQDAARLQLDLLERALDEDLTSKDASAYNVQWKGARPVFIDVASFEPWTPGQPWFGYLQFCQLFLYPLLLTAYRDVPFQPWLRGALDGIEPEQMRSLLSLRDRFRAGVLADVVLLAKLQARTAGADEPVRGDLVKAGFKKAMITNNLRRLRRIVDGLRWRREASEWADYAGTNTYDDEAHQTKVRFVASVAETRHRRLAWDLGANTGTFSRLVAPHADTVVALDVDHLAVDRLYRSLRAEGPANILPLVGNLADASPGLGWRARERKTLEERGRPELVLALALIHHLVLRANVPLPEVIEWLGGLGAELVIEWVSKDDAMVRKLLRNKDDIYDDYTPEVFEASLRRHFEIVRQETIHGGTRTLVHARPIG